MPFVIPHVGGMIKRILMIGLLVLSQVSQGTGEYNPLQLSHSESIKPLDLVVHDSKRGRDIPILVCLPHTTKAAPVILFSHRLGGSKTTIRIWPSIGLHGDTSVYSFSIQEVMSRVGKI